MLESLAARVKNGLIPTHFSEDGSKPSYDGADTALWFIHALWQYVRYTADQSAAVKKLLDAALDIIHHYRNGTDLGIRVDGDGLIASRCPGAGTSWMDAKVGDWVITPRIGRPVELNALWYNALRIVSQLCEKIGDARHADELSVLADRVKVAFNQRFWNDAESCCFDVVEDHGPDPAIRPNQVLAISLPFPVLEPRRHAAVLEKIRTHLLTQYGLRTLAPDDHAYRSRYGGNVVSRDRALHQGSVHPWLLGHYVTATMKLVGRADGARALARQLLEPCIAFIVDQGAGQLPELFDGDAPHRAGGAIACATSVGEILRAYVEDVLDQAPKASLPPVLTMNVKPTVTL